MAAVPNARPPACPITQPFAEKRASRTYPQGGAWPTGAEGIATQSSDDRPARQAYPKGAGGWTDAEDGHQEKRTTSVNPVEPDIEARGCEGQAQGTSSPNFPFSPVSLAEGHLISGHGENGTNNATIVYVNSQEGDKLDKHTKTARTAYLDAYQRIRFFFAALVPDRTQWTSIRATSTMRAETPRRGGVGTGPSRPLRHM